MLKNLHVLSKLSGCEWDASASEKVNLS